MTDSRLRPKICKECGGHFRGRSKRVYCSDACKYRHKYPPKGNHIKYGRVCANCGKTYDGPRNKYCSDECFAAVCSGQWQDGKARRRKKKRDIIVAAKNRPCQDCGGKFPHYVMDLHHRDPSDKDFTLSSSMGKSIPAILDEIEKCDVLCANCHRERHHGKNG